MTKKTLNNSHVILVLLCVTSLAALAAVSTRGYLLLHNTLSNNGQWISTKTKLKKGVIGAYAFLDGQQALAKEMLNLGSWHGFQEVVWADSLEAVQVKYSFSLEPDGYLSFTFNRQQDRFLGIRLSASERFANIHFRATSAGEFERKEKLDVATLEPNTWYRVTVDIGKDSTLIFLDDVRVGVITEHVADRQLIGFRGAFHESYIDDVMIRTRSGQVVHESFRNRKGESKVLTFSLLVAIVLDAILVFLLWTLGRMRGKELGFAVLMSNLVLLAIGIALAGFQYVTAPNYPVVNENMKNREAYWKQETAAELAQSIRDRYTGVRDTLEYRILFIGSSQTWGAGAFVPEQTFVRRVEHHLNNTHSPGRRVECINGGISGNTAGRQLQFYRSEWIGLDLDAVVINLSSNDSDLMAFGANLSEIVDLSLVNQVTPILMLEANSSESETSFLNSKHEVVRRLGESSGIPVIDMHGHLEDKRDEGFLWWDFVHLTPFGQELVARKLSAELRHILAPSS